MTWLCEKMFKFTFDSHHYNTLYPLKVGKNTTLLANSFFFTVIEKMFSYISYFVKLIYRKK